MRESLQIIEREVNWKKVVTWIGEGLGMTAMLTPRALGSVTLGVLAFFHWTVHHCLTSVSDYGHSE